MICTRKHNSGLSPRLIPRRGSGVLTLLLTLWLFAGCGGTEGTHVQVPDPGQPESFAAAAQTWVLKREMEPNDEEVLTKFFQLHAHFQGSTDFAGSPIMYVSGMADRRYYWMRGAAGELVWSCVHFEGGKFSVSEGKGNPFVHQA